MSLGAPAPVGARPAPPPGAGMGMDPDSDNNAQIKDLVGQLAEALGGHCVWGGDADASAEGMNSPEDMGDSMGGGPPAGGGRSMYGS